MNGNHRYSLRIEYTDQTYLIKEFDTKEEAYWFVHNEGDHVLGYGLSMVDGSRKNKK